MINDTEKVIIFAFKKWRFEKFDKFSLTVECWKNDNEAFGLNGFKSVYPNSNKVFTIIMGKKQRNIFKMLGDNYYKLNENYLAEIEKINFKIGGKTEIEKINNELREDTRKEMLRILKSDAFNFFQSNNLNQIAHIDAYMYWKLHQSSDQSQLRESREIFENSIKNIKDLLSTKDEINISSNIKIDKKNLKQIIELDQYLSEKFADELKIIGRRSKKDGRSSYSKI